MSNGARSEPPPPAECGEAMTRALRARLKIHRNSLDHLHMTNAALQERVTGLPLPDAERAAGDWWRVGSIVDMLADREFDVWYRPGPPRRLAVSERVRPTVMEPAPPVMAGGLEALYEAHRAAEAKGIES